MVPPTALALVFTLPTILFPHEILFARNTSPHVILFACNIFSPFNTFSRAMFLAHNTFSVQYFLLAILFWYFSCISVQLLYLYLEANLSLTPGASQLAPLCLERENCFVFYPIDLSSYCIAFVLYFICILSNWLGLLFTRWLLPDFSATWHFSVQLDSPPRKSVWINITVFSFILMFTPIIHTSALMLLSYRPI